jgi:hypothetical protein
MSVRDPRVTAAVRLELGQPGWTPPAKGSRYSKPEALLVWQHTLDIVAASCVRHEYQIHLLTPEERAENREAIAAEMDLGERLPYRCPPCGWRGPGRELRELACPQCSNLDVVLDTEGGDPGALQEKEKDPVLLLREAE